jgi:hypothetical protein
MVKRFASRTLVVWAVWATTACQPVLGAGLDLEDMAIYSVRPEKLIEHEVTLESPLDAKRWEPVLEGPTYHSFSSVRGVHSNEVARFNWYALAKSIPAPTRKVAVAIQHPRRVRVEFQLGEAVYFLSTSQRLAEGKPPPAPKQLSHLVAYRITGDAESGYDVQAEIPLETAESEVRLKRPVLLCLPVQEWHHDDYSPVGDADFCLIVYETEVQGSTNNPEIGTLDQFGLNSLRLKRAGLVGVSARTLSDD